MKILSVAFLLMLALAFVLLGCSDKSAPIMAPNEQPLSTPASSSSLAKEGVLHSATGSGRLSIYQGALHNELWTFSAIQHSGGSFSGEVEYHDWEVGYKMHGKIIDLKVVEVAGGKQAKLAFKIMQNTIPEEWGRFVYCVIVIQDNGEGEKDWATAGWGLYENGSDGITVQQWVDMTPAEFIAELNFLGAGDPWVYTHGNFQVR